MNQNAISRLENPTYGKATITTLKRIAAAFDVGLVIRFVPFSQMVNWVSGTPHVDEGLSPKSLRVPSFNEELAPVRIMRRDLGSVEGEMEEADVVSRSQPYPGLGCLASSVAAGGAAGAAR